VIPLAFGVDGAQQPHLGGDLGGQVGDVLYAYVPWTRWCLRRGALSSRTGPLLACERVGFMPLSAYQLRASIAVSDMQKAVAFYEGTLGLEVLQSGPSANIADGSRVYGSGGGPALNVYQSVTAGKTSATLAAWYVEDIDQIVDELALSGVEFIRYDQLEHDAKGITARAGGGRIAWFQDPDGNTFALEADV
jgi:catechol 2,3-dioxygenase-like lactoylglutathione lyase family enzyme